jgi:cullin 3
MANSGLDAMIDHDELEDLSHLYDLYSLVPEGVPCLRRSLKSSVQRRGTELNSVNMEGRELRDGDAGDEFDASARGIGKGKARPPPNALGFALALQWAEGVLQLKDNFDGLWETAFKSNREIGSGLNEVIHILS